METIASRVDAPDAADWVGIRRASEILGVHPSTLREWTRAGRLDAFVTPGGHRRYRASDLQMFPGVTRSSDAVASLTGLLLGCQRQCGLGGACVIADSAGLDGCDEIARCRLRLLGASLLRLLTTCWPTTMRTASAS
jgi:excisionase family DNA binding protein